MGSGTAPEGAGLNLDALDKDNAAFLVDVLGVEDASQLPAFERSSENILHLHSLKTLVYNATRADVLLWRDAERQAREYAAERKHVDSRS